MAIDNRQEFEKHSFASFLKKYRVEIPMVQRDYAQGRTTDDVNRVRSRFLEAIKQCLASPDSQYEIMKMDFVYGEKEKIWSQDEADKIDYIKVTPLDGQQRLTTLYLLHWYASRKEEIITEDQTAFLDNFTYDIRPSSKSFCKKLMKFYPSFDTAFSSQLIDQNWFMGEWHNDPTIQSMLVMLDAIKEGFSGISNLWKKLVEDERIIFYFLPLSENGLSDELYIKMNSRGKKLTAFEHFKAEYEALYEKDSEESISINHKFDVEWIDTLFPYRSNNGTVDNEFMKYFFFVSHILCYEQSIEKSGDEFVLINSLYKENPKAKENREYLEKAFDCWYKVMNEFNSIDEFFKNFLSVNAYEPGKVSTFKYHDAYHGTQNFFYACIKLYQLNNNFSYSDFLFLYGIITYLINKDNEDSIILEIEFRDRLRILRNLIWNSNSGEIRGDGDYMKDLMGETKELILTGVVNKGYTHGFKDLQEDEEIEKIEKKKTMTETELSNMYTLEDHPMLYGYVSGIRYDNLYLAGDFKKLFENDYLNIHRALISLGDYMQEDDNRYYMGNNNRSTWTQLLHKSRNRYNFEEKTMAVLIQLLEKIHLGETLEGIISSFTTAQEAEGLYPWRYYFAKYPNMLRGSDGELTWGDNDYVCTTLNRHQFNGQHWNPFLNVINSLMADNLKNTYGEKVMQLENYGENLYLLHPSASVESTAKGYVFYQQSDNTSWPLLQDENGIDKEDRILFAIEKIQEVVKRHYESLTESSEIQESAISSSEMS